MRPKMILASAIVMLPLLVSAHSAKLGPNGGPQVDAGNFHVELISSDTTITFYLRDHNDAPVATSGYKGTAIFVIDGTAHRIALTPAGENRLRGTSPAPLPTPPKGAIQITPPSGKTFQGRFN